MAVEASRTLVKTTEDSRMVRSMVSVIGGASKRMDRSVVPSRTNLAGTQERMSTREAAERAVQQVAAEKEAGPVQDQENGGKQV